jgi:sporulation protein YlmC with PRC-barrel domain
MRSILLGAAAALAISTGAFAQNSDAGANPQFIQNQEAGQVRAPKLVGVSVYDKENKNIGKIDDILLDKSGRVQAVVIGVGGFLGIGKKDVALPFDAIKWQTEQRTVATNGTAPGAAMDGANNLGATTTTNGAATQPVQKTVSPAEQEAYNGYPDRAVVDFSGATLKNAPEFKYASQTMNSDGTRVDTAPAQKP